MFPMSQAPLFLLQQLYFTISILEVVFWLQNGCCNSKPYFWVPGRERNERGRANGHMLVQSAESPTQRCLLVFHWLELDQMSTLLPSARKPGRWKFLLGTLTLLPTCPQIGVLLERKRERMNLGSANLWLFFLLKLMHVCKGKLESYEKEKGMVAI